MAKPIEIDYEPGPFDGLPATPAARGTSAPAPKLVPVDYEPEPYEGGLPTPNTSVVLPSIKRVAGQFVESVGTTIKDITGENAVTRGLHNGIPHRFCRGAIQICLTRFRAGRRSIGSHRSASRIPDHRVAMFPATTP